MTKKLNPLDDPPTASSSDDDDVESSDASSSSEDQSNKAPIKATTAAPSKSTAADSDSGSETETDSDSEPMNPPNSGSGKTMAVNQKKKEDLTALALPAVKSGTKRPANEATASTKRVKKVSVGGGEEESIKKPAFHRLWSEEDEIAVLQGMIDFKGDTGKSPYEDTNGFYEFIKKSISFEVSKNQFMDKIRSLRKKYIGKEVKNGVEPSFVKAHDQKAFELSKFIWGPEGIASESNVKSNGVSKKSQNKTKQEVVFVAPSTIDKKVEEDDDKVLVDGSDWFGNSSLVRMIAGLGGDEYYVKQGWSLVPVESKKLIEKKLKSLQAKEFEIMLEKTEFLHKVTSMIVEASKNKQLNM